MKEKGTFKQVVIHTCEFLLNFVPAWTSTVYKSTYFKQSFRMKEKGTFKQVVIHTYEQGSICLTQKLLTMDPPFGNQHHCLIWSAWWI